MPVVKTSKTILSSVRGRKVEKLSQLINPTGVYHGQTASKRLKVIDWIGQNTTGRFFFDDKKVYFEKEKTFQIGDISITPYWADHSAFDAYSFFIEANGKNLFYSGDFRAHGRKSGVFYWFTNNAPQNIDYLLLEGTTIGRANKPFKSETKTLGTGTPSHFFPFF